MVAFYKKLLNAEAGFESSRIAYPCFDGSITESLLALSQELPTKIPTSAGLEHIAFGFHSLQDLALSYRQRKKLGIEPTWCVNHEITMSIYYEDPDGNHLETQVDLFDNNDKATDFILSKEFKDNPIGVDFDPEEFVRHLQSGEDLASIKKRPEIGPRGTPVHLLNKH